MLKEYSENKFDEQTVSCDNCHWKGKGSDTVIIDFYGLSDECEIHCPQCDERIGILKKQQGPPGESASDLSFQLG